MKCELCKKNQATVHFTELTGKVNGKSQKLEVHLCEECAKQKKVILKSTLSISAASGLVQQAASVVERIPRELAELKCPSCGMTYPEFRAKTRFGCSEDYFLFEKGIEPLLLKIHGSVQHAGKVPSRAGADTKLRNELVRLRQDLEREIGAEHYEKAAEIRDRIKGLETEIDRGGVPSPPG